MRTTIGRIFEIMNFDKKYKKRTDLMNESVKSLGNGISLSFQLLGWAICFLLTQIYYVPKNYFFFFKKFHFLITIISMIIITIGFF